MKMKPEDSFNVDKEFVPLLVPANSENFKKEHLPVHYVANEVNDDEELSEISDGALFFKKSGTSSLVSDAVVMLLEFLQIFALLQSLSLRLPWPPLWVRNTNFLMLFNFDLWEFVKVHTNGTYKSVKDYYTPSSTVPMPFWSMLILWGSLIIIFGTAYVVVYILLHKKNNPFLLVQLARLQRIFIIVIQVVCLPIGVSIGKLFHCTNLGTLDVDNDVVCTDVIHICAYIIPSVIFAVLFFTVPVVLLTIVTRRETLRMGTKKHEQYLQLKELEYNHRIDMLWVIAHFHIFASFKNSGLHYRAGMHVGKLILLIIYASMFQYPLYQAILLTVTLSILFVTFCVIRPYRVRSFNTMLILNYLCLSAAALIGSMIATYDPYTVQSPWFTPDYSIWVMVLIGLIWLFGALIFIIHITLRYHGLCFCYKRSLWPSLTSEGIKNLGPFTKKYLKAMLRSRTVLERVLAVPPIFAPVHELVREIRIINAYTREAEYLDDPIHHSLLDVLDELIDSHSQLTPKSLFAASIKDNIRKTASEFMQIMPKFVDRLAQREYDFLLMNPRKRRMLLKMYCMGVFLNGRKDKVRKQLQIAPAVEKIWMQKEENDVGGYYEEIYPPPLLSFQPFRPQAAVLDHLLMSDDEDDDKYLAMLDAWAENNPISHQDRLNGSLLNLLEEWKEVQSRESGMSELTPDERFTEVIPQPGTSEFDPVSGRDNTTFTPEDQDQDLILAVASSNTAMQLTDQDRLLPPEHCDAGADNTAFTMEDTEVGIPIDSSDRKDLHSDKEKAQANFSGNQEDDIKKVERMTGDEADFENDPTKENIPRRRSKSRKKSSGNNASDDGKRSITRSEPRDNGNVLKSETEKSVKPLELIQKDVSDDGSDDLISASVLARRMSRKDLERHQRFSRKDNRKNEIGEEQIDDKPEETPESRNYEESGPLV